MSASRLVVDIGNSDTVVGLFENNAILETHRWPSKLNNSTELVKLQFENCGVDTKKKYNIYLSSVVPHLNLHYQEYFQEKVGLPTEIVAPADQKLLTIGIDDPSQLGSDLFINALMADHLFKSCPKIIIDFGTALTFTTVSSKGMLLGVNIVPGIKTALKSLFSDATLLPNVMLEKPKEAIGKNTITAIQSGIVYGYEGLIKNIVKNIEKELGEPAKLIATGGLSVFSDIFEMKFDLIDKEFTLKGLNLYGSLIDNIS